MEWNLKDLLQSPTETDTGFLVSNEANTVNAPIFPSRGITEVSRSNRSQGSQALHTDDTRVSVTEAKPGGKSTRRSL